MPQPTPKTVTSSQPFQDPQGNVLANGYLTLDLNTVAVITGGSGQVAPSRVTITLTSGGLVPGGTVMWANDQLSPSGTFYTVRIYNSNNLVVGGPLVWNVAGASPIDLSQLANQQPIATPQNAVLQNPNGSQSVSNFGLTLISSAPLAVQSAASLNRMVFNQGTALSNPDFALSGWGSGAAISNITGTDAFCRFTITAGSSPSTGPTVTLTYHDGTWNNPPFVVAHVVGGTGAISDLSQTVTATTVALTYQSTPVSGLTYIITVSSAGNTAINFTQPPQSAALVNLGAFGAGNGTGGQMVLTKLQGTGSGPANPTTIVGYSQLVIGVTTYWVPLFQ